jgi:hypothetical protein
VERSMPDYLRGKNAGAPDCVVHGSPEAVVFVPLCRNPDALKRPIEANKGQ